MGGKVQIHTKLNDLVSCHDISHTRIYIVPHSLELFFLLQSVICY